MRYLKQITIIFTITFLGEVLHEILPLPIPASIYGLVIMLVSLMTGIVKVNQVSETGNFLLDIMPVMFIPAAVGLMTMWRDILNVIIPLVFIALFTTVLVMVATGKMTDYILKKEGK